jgi:hypothetical protein
MLLPFKLYAVVILLVFAGIWLALFFTVLTPGSSFVETTSATLPLHPERSRHSRLCPGVVLSVVCTTGAGLSRCSRFRRPCRQAARSTCPTAGSIASMRTCNCASARSMVPRGHPRHCITLQRGRYRERTVLIEYSRGTQLILASGTRLVEPALTPRAASFSIPGKPLPRGCTDPRVSLQLFIVRTVLQCGLL